jgi:hypothetical protein
MDQFSSILGKILEIFRETGLMQAREKRRARKGAERFTQHTANILLDKTISLL